MAATHIDSHSSCGYLHKKEPVKIPALCGGAPGPHAEEKLWQSEQGESCFPEGAAMGRLPMFLWVAPQPCADGQH